MEVRVRRIEAVACRTGGDRAVRRLREARDAEKRLDVEVVREDVGVGERKRVVLVDRRRVGGGDRKVVDRCDGDGDGCGGECGAVGDRVGEGVGAVEVCLRRVDVVARESGGDGSVGGLGERVDGGARVEVRVVPQKTGQWDGGVGVFVGRDQVIDGDWYIVHGLDVDLDFGVGDQRSIGHGVGEGVDPVEVRVRGVDEVVISVEEERAVRWLGEPVEHQGRLNIVVVRKDGGPGQHGGCVLGRGEAVVQRYRTVVYGLEFDVYGSGVGVGAVGDGVGEGVSAVEVGVGGVHQVAGEAG